MGWEWSKLEANITSRDACPIPFPFHAFNQEHVNKFRSKSARDIGGNESRGYTRGSNLIIGRRVGLKIYWRVVANREMKSEM